MKRLKPQTILGLAAVLLYLGLVFGVIPGPERLLISLAFFIGPIAVIGMVSLHQRLRQQNASLLVDGGIVLLIAAFVLFDLMVVVQQTVFWFRKEALAAAVTEAAREQVTASYLAVNGVQLGADIAFDVFYCVGMFLVSAAMWNDRRFGRTVSALGLVTAGGLLALNLVTFPNPPDRAGLIDLGPLSGVWWIAVIILLQRLAPLATAGGDEVPRSKNGAGDPD